MAREVAKERYDRRTDAYEHVASALDALDGVDDTTVDDYHPRTAESARIIVDVEHGAPSMVGPGPTSWPLHANLRSLAPRLYGELQAAAGDGIISEWQVVSKPESVGDGEHDQPHYYIDVWAP